MLMDILMESLMSMDEDTLDYVLESCSDEEIELIDDMVMEASQPMSAQDKEDFDFINKVQRQASSKDGWAGVDKSDRDKFVNIMTHTKNLKVLKKAANLGEKEALHDAKVKNALGVIGATVGGGLAGGIIGDEIGKKNRLELLGKFSRAENAIKDSQKDLNNKYVNDGLNFFIFTGKKNANGEDLYRLGNGKITTLPKRDSAVMDLINANDDLKHNLANLNNRVNEGPSFVRGIGSELGLNAGAVGAIAGAGVSAAAIAAKKGIKHAKDLKALKAQGETMTPTAAYKANRRAIANAEKFERIRNKMKDK